MNHLKYFSVILLTGPRQSGKTTLLKNTMAHYDYINLESPDQLALIKEDPKGFLEKSREYGLIIDEAQKYPELFSYIQVIVDQSNKKGQFILSGSQNFLLCQNVSQSLAGRLGILELLPLTYNELHSNSSMTPPELWSFIQQGGYPRPYQEKIPTDIWLDSYIQTYVEKDVRNLLRVKDLNLFTRFLRLCAGRHGQLLNQNQLAIDAGISHTTVSEWLSILEASYIIFQLPPYHNNFNKRLTKSKKLYFYDSGLVCHLLGIRSINQLEIHAAKGAVFEGYVISEIKKIFLNQGIKPVVYFWRDSNGNEVDLIIENGLKLQAIEIKSTSTFRTELLKSLKKWSTISNQSMDLKLIYAGDAEQDLNGINLLPCSNLRNIFLIES